MISDEREWGPREARWLGSRGVAMVAYFIAHGTVKDQVKLDQYIARASACVAAAGGEFVSAGDVKAVLLGHHSHKRVAIFRFPDAASARAWFDTPEYQSLASLRAEAAEFVFLVFEEYQQISPQDR
jgi:uncharacterized protein (DUF1330 family)